MVNILPGIGKFITDLSQLRSNGQLCKISPNNVDLSNCAYTIEEDSTLVLCYLQKKGNYFSRISFFTEVNPPAVSLYMYIPLERLLPSNSTS